ncbi:MAG: T9SS type A sorting domain-containing protein [Sediminibacterium sp.]|nr:T9SS type A sorting domain-containing protein [Sediminibacterium sp.]
MTTKLFVVLLMGLVSLMNTSAQAQTIQFTYDAGGNMIQRQVQVMPPIPPGSARFGLPLSKTDSTEVTPPIDFKVYPNPATNAVTLDGTLPEGIREAKVRILTTNAQVLLEQVYAGGREQIDVSRLTNGLYLMEVQYSKKQKSTYRLVISH